MRKFTTFPSILILIIFSFFSIIVFLNWYNNKEAENIDENIALELKERVYNYLFEQGYKKEDIYELKIQYNPKMGDVSDAYSVNVIFKDEQDMNYKYAEIKGEIVQVGFSGSHEEGKHTE